jgi:hypothetical protein
MKRIFCFFIVFVWGAACAQPYVQAGSSVYTSSLGAATSSSVDLGYSSGFFDSSVGVFTARQNTRRGDVNWSGLQLGATAHAKIAGPVTAYVGYQISQTPSGHKADWDGRYGVGLTWHATPIKISLVIAPEQRAWDGSKVDMTVGIAVKVRGWP